MEILSCCFYMKVEVAGKMVEIPDDYDPRKTDEEYMCENHRAFFKKKLLDWKDEITSKLFADISGEESGEDMDRRSTDESDNMSAEMQTLQELRQKDRLRKLMIKIEENINKIDQDTYGFCEETGNEIGINRLIMRPIARYCLEVQERKDMEEKEKEFIDYNQEETRKKTASDDDE